MVRFAWLRRAGPGIVAVTAAGLVASTTLGARDRPWTPPACVGHDRTDVEPEARPGVAADRAVTTASGTAAWFRLDPVLDASGGLSGQRLVVGRADRTAGWTLGLDRESFAAGPFGAIVLAGTDDGSGSRLLALDVVAGCTTTLDTSSDVIRRATVGQDGRSVIEARVERSSRTDLGIWQRHLDDGTAATRIVEPLGTDARFGRTWSTEFLWALDRTNLAIQSCGASACRTRILDPASDSVDLVADPDLGQAIGLADGRLVSYLACRGLPCPIVAVELATRTRRSLASDAATAVVIASDDGPRLVHEDLGGPRPFLRSVALDGLAGRDLGPVPTGLHLAAGPAWSAAGFDAPPGWAMLAPDGRMSAGRVAPAPILRHVLDGRSVAVDSVLR